MSRKQTPDIVDKFEGMVDDLFHYEKNRLNELYCDGVEILMRYEGARLKDMRILEFEEGQYHYSPKIKKGFLFRKHVNYAKFENKNLFWKWDNKKPKLVDLGKHFESSQIERILMTFKDMKKVYDIDIDAVIDE